MVDWVHVKDREEFSDLEPVDEYTQDVIISRIAYTPQCNF